MKTPSLRCTAVAACFAVAAGTPALAAEAGDTGPYAGITAAQDMVSISFPVVEDASSAGILLGYRFAPEFGIELATGGADHDISTFPGCVMESTTVGIYGAFRSQGTVYLKGRAGLLSEDLVSSGICGGVAADDVGMSYGLGAGVRMGKAALEIEYTQVEMDVGRIGATLLINF